MECRQASRKKRNKSFCQLGGFHQLQNNIDILQLLNSIDILQLLNSHCWLKPIDPLLQPPKFLRYMLHFLSFYPLILHFTFPGFSFIIVILHLSFIHHVLSFFLSSIFCFIINFQLLLFSSFDPDFMNLSDLKSSLLELKKIVVLAESSCFSLVFKPINAQRKYPDFLRQVAHLSLLFIVILSFQVFLLSF